MTVLETLDYLTLTEGSPDVRRRSATLAADIREYRARRMAREDAKRRMDEETEALLRRRT